MTEPQTPEQVVQATLRLHSYVDLDVRCACGHQLDPSEEFSTIEDQHDAHQAAQVVAALGLREEWAVDYSAEKGRSWVDGWIGPLSSLDIARRVAAEKTDGKVMHRRLMQTDWAEVPADER